MSFQAMTWATEQTCGSAAAKLVLLMLANHSNGHTGQCNPRHKRLAVECDMTVDTLKSHLKKLESLGFIKIVPQYTEGVQLPNQYILNLGGGGGENYPEGRGNSYVDGGGKNSPPNNQEVKTVTKPKTSTVFVLPDWIPLESWDALMEVRKAAKAQGTDYAKKLLVNQLAKYKASGHDPVDIINTSIRNSWKDVYEPKVESNHRQQSSETPYQRSMREKYQTIAPSIAAQNPNAPRIDVNTFFDTLPAKKLEITNG